MRHLPVKSLPEAAAKEVEAAGYEIVIPVSPEWGLERKPDLFWEDKYWQVAKQFGELNRRQSELDQLRRQVRGLVDLTLHLTKQTECWHTVGDTVYIDHEKLRDLILERKHSYERAQREVREECRYLALSESKYL